MAGEVALNDGRYKIMVEAMLKSALKDDFAIVISDFESFSAPRGPWPPRAFSGGSEEVC